MFDFKVIPALRQWSGEGGSYKTERNRQNDLDSHCRLDEEVVASPGEAAACEAE